jgi:hypothetical protein
MSRIDLQNMYGDGDIRKGEKKVRIVDEENDMFQLAARWPSPEYRIHRPPAHRGGLFRTIGASVSRT